MRAPRADPPLTMEEVACIFVECSQTGNPVLTAHKYTPIYQKMKNELAGKEDPYWRAARWLDQENWVINVGLNAAQFCDCLAKCGLLAYSKENTFSEILPSAREKIEHFFSVYLGLLDSEKKI